MRSVDERMTDSPMAQAQGNLRRLEQTNLSRQAFAALRAAILNGEIAPGARIWETETAVRLGVSRAPIREALRLLEHEGLVQSFPRRGATVVVVPDHEVRALQELRAAIESRAFERVAREISDENLGALDGALEDVRLAFANRDLEAEIAADLRFHEFVIELSGFVVLRRVWSNIDGIVRVIVYRTVEARGDDRYQRADFGQFPHSVLVDALRRHDPIAAGSLASAHILEVNPVVATAQDEPAEQPAG